MRIAILGSRGIPNIYGGFERFAEKAGPMLVERGHEVIVYCSAYHPLKDEWWKGVQRILCSDPEDTIGTAGQFMYDLNCIRDAREQKLDVILQLGYTSSSVWSFLFPDEVSVITNMDGMEWQRSKYSRPVQLFLQKAEAWAGQYSTALIADSKAIESYLLEKYELPVRYISYGADIPEEADMGLLEEWGLEAEGFDLVVARMEPENQIEAIIRANREDLPLVLVGNADDGFGKKLWHRYGGDKVRFIGGVYDKRKLAALRAGSRYYFHGHSVGGTNPSLLEAMAAGCRIIAHDNVYNRDVLEENALYFERETDLMGLDPEAMHWENSVQNNLAKIKSLYNWDRVVEALEEFMNEIHASG